MNDKTKEKNKRKISIITVFLWIFLVVTMVVIVNDSIKNANALEENNKITMRLSMYDKTDTTENIPVNEIVWNKTRFNYYNQDSVAILKLDIDGYSSKNYKPGELKILLKPYFYATNQIELGDISPNWKFDNYEYEIVNKYEIKKGQKIFGTLQWLFTHEILNGDKCIYAIMCDNEDTISASNTCNIKFQVEEEFNKNQICDVNFLDYYDAERYTGYYKVPNAQEVEELSKRSIEFSDLFSSQEVKWTPKINYTRDSSKEYAYDGEDIEIVNDFIYLTNDYIGSAFRLEEEDYNFTGIEIPSSMKDLKFSIYIKGREDVEYKLFKNSIDISEEFVIIEDEDITKVKILIENVKEVNIEDLSIFANVHIQDKRKYDSLTLTSLLDIGYIRIYDDFESGITIKDEYIDLPILYSGVYGEYGEYYYSYNRKINNDLEKYDNLNFGEKLDRKQIIRYSCEKSGIGLFSSKIIKMADQRIFPCDNINIKNEAVIMFGGKQFDGDMKLKIYNVLSDTMRISGNLEESIKSSLVVKNANDTTNVNKLDEIRDNLEINVTKMDNGTNEKKIEVIIDCSSLKELEWISDLEIEFSYFANSPKETMVQSIKKYAMWEQQNTYSYFSDYFTTIEGVSMRSDDFGVLNADVDDIDNDGDRDELLITVNEYFWLYSKNSLWIRKEWKDNNNEKNLRPDSIIVELKANDEVINEYELNKDNDWFKNVDVEPFDINGNEVKYTVDEKYDVSGYEKQVDGTTITNERKDLVKIEIPVEKIWEDEDNKAGRRDEIVTIQLKDGDNIIEEASLTEENNWKYTFTNLPKYREDGSIIEYTIDEKETNEFYEKTIDGYKIINKYIGRAEDGIANDEKNVENGVDTSDINIWLYVVIAVISIVVIVVVIILIMKRINK